MEQNLTARTNDIHRVLAQVEQMPERQRQRIADGIEEDEHFIVRADEFPTDEAFHNAIVVEMIRLFDFR